MTTHELQNNRQQREQGQVIIIFALASLLLVGMMALAVDVGFLLAERRQVQAAADAGVMAAAQASIDGQPWVAAGRMYGSINAEVPEANVQVNNPPTQGRFAGDADYIEVIVTKEVERYFLGAVYQGDWSVTASAVALSGTVTIDAALLALNEDSGGIRLNMSGGLTHIHIDGGSAVSNFNIQTAGNARLTATGQVTANQGISSIPGNVVQGDGGTIPNAPIVADPLADLISPPTLPSVPANPVPTVNPPPASCYVFPGWSGSGIYQGNSGTFPANEGTCAHAQGTSGPIFVFPHGNYNFGNNSRLHSSYYHSIRVDGGIHNYTGSDGGMRFLGPQNLEVRSGQYSFLNGAKFQLQSNTQTNIIGGGTYYFHGGGGMEITQGPHFTIFNPGTYIFNGGTGLLFSGNNRAHFNAGYYEFWFTNGADFSMLNSSGITSDPGAYAVMRFYGAQGNPSSMLLDGNAQIQLPAGQYYFSNGNLEGRGSTSITGNNIFFYFTDGGRMLTTGSSVLGFTAPTTQIYPGYVPGVFLYSDASNTATFSWQMRSAFPSQGVVYIPSGRVELGGNSSGIAFTGQIIADSFATGGNTVLNLTYEQFIDSGRPQVFLVD